MTIGRICEYCEIANQRRILKVDDFWNPIPKMKSSPIPNSFGNRQILKLC